MTTQGWLLDVALTSQLELDPSDVKGSIHIGLIPVFQFIPLEASNTADVPEVKFAPDLLPMFRQQYDNNIFTGKTRTSTPTTLEMTRL